MNIPEHDLWIAVIEQALFDATLGLGSRKHSLVRVGGSTLGPYQIKRARHFIFGRTGALQDICEAMGADYAAMREQLISAYRQCVPLMPEEWREE